MERTKEERQDFRKNIRFFNSKLRSDKKQIHQADKEIAKLQKRREKLIISLGNAYYNYTCTNDDACKDDCNDLCDRIRSLDKLIQTYEKDLSSAKAELTRHSGMKKSYRSAWKSGNENDLELIEQ